MTKRKPVFLWVSKDRIDSPSIVWGIEPKFDEVFGWSGDHVGDYVALSELVRSGECVKYEIRRAK